MCYGSW